MAELVPVEHDPFEASTDNNPAATPSPSYRSATPEDSSALNRMIGAPVSETQPQEPQKPSGEMPEFERNKSAKDRTISAMIPAYDALRAAERARERGEGSFLWNLFNPGSEQKQKEHRQLAEWQEGQYEALPDYLKVIRNVGLPAGLSPMQGLVGLASSSSRPILTGIGSGAAIGAGLGYAGEPGSYEDRLWSALKAAGYGAALGGYGGLGAKGAQYYQARPQALSPDQYRVFPGERPRSVTDVGAEPQLEAPRKQIAGPKEPATEGEQSKLVPVEGDPFSEGSQPLAALGGDDEFGGPKKSAIPQRRGFDAKTYGEIADRLDKAYRENRLPWRTINEGSKALALEEMAELRDEFYELESAARKLPDGSPEFNELQKRFDKLSENPLFKTAMGIDPNALDHLRGKAEQDWNDARAWELQGEKPGETYHALAGERGAENLAAAGRPAAKQAIALAEELEAKGADRDQIWQATSDYLRKADPNIIGAFRGIDGKWRFEIDDSGAHWKPEIAANGLDVGSALDSFKYGFGRGAMVGDLLSHKEAYSVYPFLEKLALEPIKSLGANGSFHNGSYDNAATIRLNTLLTSDERALATILHEKQHAIQRGEGFATGANPAALAPEIAQARYEAKELESQLRRLQNAAGDEARVYIARANSEGGDFADYVRKAKEYWFEKLGEKSEDNPFGVDEHQAVQFQLIEDDPIINSLVKRYNDLLKAGRIDPQEAYRRHAGETEARNVQSRLRMTAEERRATPPWKTQDIPDEQQIIRYGGGQQNSIAEPSTTGHREARTAVEAGKPYEVSPDVVTAMREAVAPHLEHLPEGIRPGIVTKVEPHSDPRGVMVHFETPEGEEKSIGLRKDAFFGRRALFDPNTRTLLFSRLNTAGDLNHLIGGESAHEGTHALFGLNEVPEVIDRLLSHAESPALRVMDMPLNQYLRYIGDPAYKQAPATPLREIYAEEYKGRPDFDQAMKSEAVAHLRELYYHDRFGRDPYTPEELQAKYGPALEDLEGFYNGERGKGSSEKFIDLSPEERALTVNDILHPDYPALKPRSRNVEEIARELRDRGSSALKKLGVNSGRIEEASPETDEMLSRAIASEIIGALNRGGKTSHDWYTRKVEEAMAVASTMHPEIVKDENARSAFTSAIAITSQGETVPSNTRLGELAYNYFKENGRFPTNISAAKQQSMNANFAKLNALIDEMGVDGMRDFLSSEFSVRDLEKIGYQVGKENKDTKVYGSAILGPKIGQGFYQNLNGNYDPVTMDLWFMRAWGRLTGTLVGTSLEKPRARFENALAAEGYKVPKSLPALERTAEEFFAKHEADYRKNGAMYKAGEKTKSELTYASERFLLALNGINEQPTSGSQRTWMRDRVARARDILQEHGTNITPADLQAIWWYPEKELYGKLGGRDSEDVNVDYASAFRDLAKKKGVSDDEIDSAIRALDQRSGPAGRGNVSAPTESSRKGSGRAYEEEGGGKEGSNEEKVNSSASAPTPGSLSLDDPLYALSGFTHGPEQAVEAFESHRDPKLVRRTPEQWRKLIEARPGWKDYVDWTGLDDFLSGKSEVRPGINPPTERSAYIGNREYRDALRAQYYEGDNKKASSRTTPYEGQLPTVGSWRIDDLKGNYGHDIEQLVRLPLDRLELPEVSDGKLDPVKRGDDELYAQWLREGRRAPPIEVIETDDGRLRVSDGHRRVLAAKQAGNKDVEAWVSYAVPVPSGATDTNGRPIKTGLTFEMANKKSITKDDLLSYMRAHSADLDEKVLGGSSREIDDLREQLREAQSQADQYEFGSPARDAAYERMDEVEKRLDQLEANATKFEGHKIPGGEPGSYRELLIRDKSLEGRGLSAEDQSRLEQVESRIDRVTNEGAELGDRLAEGDNSVRPHLTTLVAEREKLIKERNGLVSKGGPKYTSKHFHDQEIAHIRFDDRALPDGGKALFINEIQSDLHQQGRLKGYDRGDENFKGPFKAEQKDGYHEVTDSNGRFVSNVANWEAPTPEAAVAEVERRLRESPHQAARDQRAPNAPFKGDLWLELALKRSLRYAVEHGYDAISWARSDQIAKAVGSTKEARELQYDQKIPKFLDKYVKKWGAKVERADVVTGEDASEIRTGRDFTDGYMSQHFYRPMLELLPRPFNSSHMAMMAFGDAGRGQGTFDVLGALRELAPQNVEKAQALLEKHAEYTKPDISNPIIRITPQMRESVLGGQPYASGGKVSQKRAPSTHPHARFIDGSWQVPDPKRPDRLMKVNERAGV